MVQPFKIGLIGFGNIGAGVVRTIAAQQRLLTARSPRPLIIQRIADKDVTTRREAPYDPAILTGDVNDIFNDPEIDAVIELVGGEQPAKKFVEASLRGGKHVVTANKALLALHGPELLALAAENKVGLLYEAAVGGGIPIIRTLQQGLAANTLTGVMGILNGTCNYILTRMGESGLAFSAALEEAKQKGYAEPDPTYDIEGYDTAHKIAILASLAFGMDLRFRDVHVEGITKIQPVDIRYARELGYQIKLLGIAKYDPELASASVRVHPTLVPAQSPLGQTSMVFNGIRVDGWPIGTTFYHGRGAGADATSSAVVSDLLALAADEGTFNASRDARLAIPVGQKKLRPVDELVTHYYIRFTLADRPGAMALIGRALADHGVSIESMIQHRRAEQEEGSATVTIVTHEAVEARVQAAIREIEQHAMNAAPAFVLRVEE